MVIKKLKIYGFGRLSGLDYEQDRDGFLAPAGDSPGASDDRTLFEFIRAMLYGVSGRGDTGARKRFSPDPAVDEAGRTIRFGGEMIYEACGRTYRLTNIWGRTAGEDVLDIVDYFTGRDVRIEAGKSVGERTLHVSEAAFVSAVYSGRTSRPENLGGFEYRLGRLSAIFGIDDGKPTPREAADMIDRRLKEITNPSEKSGELDKLVIRKMSMRNELARLGETDNKIAKKRAELEAAEAEKAELDKTLEENTRIFELCDSAKTLLVKDRIRAAYDSQLGVMRQLDFAEAELDRLKKVSLIPKIIPGILCCVLGGILTWAGLSVLSKSVFAGLAQFGGALLVVGGIVLTVLACLKFANRFTLKVEGRRTTAEDEIARLRGEVRDKNEELLELLGDVSLVETEEKWRKSEAVMRSATEDERRYAVLKQSDELGDVIEGIKARLEPVERRIAEAKRDIEALCDSAGASFSEASAALEGIDDKIKRLSDEGSALKIAAASLGEADTDVRTNLIPAIFAKASSAYRKLTAEKATYRLDDGYDVTVRCSQPAKALLCLRCAISGVVSHEEDKGLVFVPKNDITPDDARILIQNTDVNEFAAV